MRTLSEIIEAVRSNSAASEDELRLAICALDSLSCFDRSDMMTMATRERENRAIRAYSSYEESFNRWKRALAVDPKRWIGATNSPENAEYQKRRNVANRIFESALAGKLPNQKGRS